MDRFFLCGYFLEIVRERYFFVGTKDNVVSSMAVTLYIYIYSFVYFSKTDVLNCF
jgi:hypothetical protein